MKKLTLGVLSLLMVGGQACTKSAPPPPPPPPTTTTTTLPAPVSVTDVTLGSAVSADKKVTSAAESFGAKDTIYASVATAGSGHAKLRALWSFTKGAKTAKVDEQMQEFESSGPQTNEFHVSKPSGWPKGDYKVEVFLGDAAAPAVAKDFKVN